MRMQRSILWGALSLGLAGCQQSNAPTPVPTSPAKAVPATEPLPVPVSEEPADLNPDEFFAAASESVVVVRNPEAGALGSGVEIRPGLFVTNCHVVVGGTRFTIERDGKTYPMRLASGDASHDICLLRGYAGRPHPAETRSAMGVRVGERVYALGNPQGFELTLSEGLVSQLRKASAAQVEPYIQTTAAISQGSSGGGLFDRKGRLIGISSFMWREGQNLNFAAPIDWALALSDGKTLAAESASDENGDAPVEPDPDPQQSATALNATAIDLINGGKPAAAIPLLERAANMEPEDAEIAGNLGYAYMLATRYGDARTALLGSLKLSPKRAATWLNLGQTYAELGDKDHAVRSVVNGYALSSRKPRVRDALARVALDPSASAEWKDAADASLAAIYSVDATSGE